MHKDIKIKIQKRINYLIDNNQFIHLEAIFDKDEILKFCFNYNRYYNHESFIAGIMRKCKSKVRAGWGDFVDGKFITVQYDWDEEDYEYLLSQIEHLAGEVASI